MTKKLKIKLIFFLFPFSIFSQINSKNPDTLFYNNDKKHKLIKTITIENGNEKTIKNYYQNGLIESLLNYKDGLLEKRQSYYESGEKQELCLYNKGLAIKKEKWHSNGLLSQQENFKITEKNDSLKSVLDGKFEMYYSTGSPQKQGHYKNNQKNGEWIEYYDNGKKKSELNYQEDIMEKALYYYYSGQLKSENRYKVNDNFKNSKYEASTLTDGEQKYYFENGKLESISHYEKGKKNGLFESWNIVGVKKSEINFCLDVYSGNFKTWFDNGKPEKNISYGKPIYDSIRKAYKEVLDGKYETYYNNGNPQQLKNFKQGKEDGALIEYHENYIKANEQNYSEGLKNGAYKRWNRNGVLIESENYIVIKQNEKLISVKDGEYLFYNEANQKIIKQCLYKNGKKEGKSSEWHHNGKLSKVCYYENDLQVGASTIWNEKGNITSELFYAIDTVDGVPKSKLSFIGKQYDQNGKIYLIYFYNDLHECYHTKLFYEDSTLKAEWYNLLNSEYNSPKFGKHTTYFSNGNVESESFNFRERPIGRTVNYFINGKPKSVTDYNDIRSSGKCGYEILWRSDGEIISFKKYKDYKTFEDIKDPIIAKQLYDNILLKPKSKGEIINGQRQGLHVSFFKQGKASINSTPGDIWIEETFKNDKHEGTVPVYYPDGKIMLEIDMKDAIANGKLLLWDTKGNKYKEENYVNGKKQGVFIEYYSNGKKEREYLYKANAKHYLSEKKWFENGNLNFASNYNETGIQHGEAIGYFENGTLSYQKNYIQGRQDGQEKYFYADGKNKSSRFYKNGLLDGESILWHENGRISLKANYKNNIKEGYWEELNYDSTLTKGYYKQDEKDSIWTYFNVQGKLIKTETYKNGILQLKPAEPEKEYMRAINSCPAGEPSHGGFICQCAPPIYSPPFNQIILQETLENQTCQCIDSTKLKVAYAPQLSELATLEEVRKKSYNFHEPIGDFYNNLFYINYQFNINRGNGLWCTFDLLAFKEIYLNIPDKNGIKLILNPCIKVGSQVSKMNLNMEIDRKDKTQTYATLKTKNLAIEFNPKLLHQWDKKLNQAIIDSTLKTADKYVASKIIFDAPKITYSLGGRIGIDKYSNPCFTTSEIGKTGLLVDFNKMVLDLDNTQSPDEINELFPSRQSKYEEYFDYENPDRSRKKESEPKINDDFVGIYVPEATIHFPENIFKNASQQKIKVAGKNILIAGQYLIGTIKINAKAIEGQKYQIEQGAEKIIFDAATIEKELKLRGIEKLQTKYDAKNAQFIIYFYLTINS